MSWLILFAKLLRDVSKEGTRCLGIPGKLSQFVCQLLLQLALLAILRGDEVLLQLLGRLAPRIAEQVRYCIRVHCHSPGRPLGMMQG